MKVILIAGMLLLSTTAGWAQQQSVGSPAEQALSSKLLQEINSSLQCGAELIRLREENGKLKEEIAKAKSTEKK